MVRPESQGDKDGDEGPEKLEESRIDQREAQAKESDGDRGGSLGFNMLVPPEGLGRVRSVT